MNVLQKNETFKRTVEGLRFHRVRFIVEEDGKCYVGYSQNRRKQPTDLSELEDKAEVQRENRAPKILSRWTVVALNSHDYIKKPSLNDYLDDSLEARIKSEIEVCEVIRRNPHPGLAVYHGCVDANGRASGLCFQQYKESLKQRVNPGSLNRHHFIESGRLLVTDVMREWPGLLRSALQHLHALGFAHNDVTPANIMLDDEDRPVIIDFDSARALGASLEGVKRTYPWYDPNASCVAPENDLLALDEIETWLFGSVKDLRFPGV
ncbi:unnamed protein product [Clonostachys chloroleuca]|uniref:Protein kinase domain-containing protein n=1 Tax=Clonostachys chloroleuca TaxID=1926264 RepID=A0AA35QG80_9HYPO|nr:unnamed protein product [Clonostachys chloroleuca]